MTEEKTNISYNNIEDISEYILNGSAKNIICMTGAGISVSAGIPDFRTPGTGLYSKLEKYKLPEPEAVFSLDYFKMKPNPFYSLAKEIYPGNHMPTPTHYFMKMLADKGLLLRIYTQNIDSLESLAGIDKSLIVAAHGNFDSASCITTGEKVDTEEVKKAIFEGETGWKKMNKKYGGLVKPDIVFFGDKLPKRYLELYKTDFEKCDLLIIMGTSLKVLPFNMLINYVSKDIPRVLINREKVGLKDKELSYLIMQLEGLNFNEDTKDVAILGDCDDGIRKLVDSLEWREELEKMIKKASEKWNKD